ncbi:hypothetical protein ACRE1U_06750 [Helicobacter himalayensis]|uniref:hypothetical protein n=1 Tax=Helicobacter himalayensis TaxID=1591088 RepID=UPI003D6F77FD
MVKLKNMDFSNARLHFAFEGLIALIPYLILPFSAPVAFFTAIFLLLILSFFSPGRFARVALGICIVIGGGYAIVIAIFVTQICRTTTTLLSI